MNDDLRRGIQQAYADGASSWATGPERIYLRLAESLVESAPRALDGLRVLDLGSGTGVASAMLLERGARPIGVDLAHAMLVEHSEWRPPGVAGDAHDLPFAAAAFDAVVAACCLNHFVPDRPLAECRRVLDGDDGFLLASSFPTDRNHPVKALVEPLLVEQGWTPPPWYADFRSRIAPITGDPDALVAAAENAGFTLADADVVEVETGVDDPEGLLAWRLSMPHTIGFVEHLPPDRQQKLYDDALEIIDAHHMPSAIALLVLTARVCPT